MALLAEYVEHLLDAFVEIIQWLDLTLDKRRSRMPEENLSHALMGIDVDDAEPAPIPGVKRYTQSILPFARQALMYSLAAWTSATETACAAVGRTFAVTRYFIALPSLWVRYGCRP